MSETVSKVREDEILCSKVRKFIYVFYEAMDTRREKLPYLYASGTPQLLWNGHAIQGVDAIAKFLNELPVTKHSFLSVDPQTIRSVGHEGWAMVSVMGQVNIGGLQHTFTHALVLRPESNSLHIHSDQYRFID